MFRGAHQKPAIASRARSAFFTGLLAASVSLFIEGCVTDSRRDSAVAIVVSHQLPAYQQVANALAARLGQTAAPYVLDGDAGGSKDVFAKLREQDSRVVIIGPRAAQVAANLPDRAVVFCLDVQADDLAAPTLRGVRATPPPAKQLRAWKILDPQLRRVTLIRGAGAGRFVREAQNAAAQLRIQLDVIEVHTDRELLYAAKRLEPDVQGLWFVPDSRVLSAEVLREVLAYSLRQGRQTLVFNSQLLGLGALISIEGDPDDIAERVIEQLHANAETPRLIPLQRARASINLEVAKQLGLTVPAAMQAGFYVL